MEKFKRYLKMPLPLGQSSFLWGARKTGKSFYLKEHYPDSVYYDLLKHDEFIRLLKGPHLLREEILELTESQLEKPIIIDEVQKVPALLDEVHWLIENSAAYFILCGSSARKLKRGAANMLGGRAWRQEFYPLVYPEIPNFDLLHTLNVGLIPSHYTAVNWKKSIKAYINDYLTEEIRAEGLVRNLAAFASFLDVAGFSNGELINYSNIARDCGIDSKTVKAYYQILVDTHLGYYLQPHKDRRKRTDLSNIQKFYFFDVGVVNGLCKQNISQLKGPQAGAALEHYILMELMAHRGLNNLDHDITFWRSKGGHEVDFVLGNAEVGIEVKISENIARKDIRGLTTFQQENMPQKCFVVCTVPRKRRLTIDENNHVTLLPWQEFLNMLWAGEIISD